MTEYPADIAEKARASLAGRRLAFDNETGYHALVSAIAQAIKEERDRCAAVCLEMPTTTGLEKVYAARIEVGWIPAAIRSGGEKP